MIFLFMEEKTLSYTLTKQLITHEIFIHKKKDENRNAI